MLNINGHNANRWLITLGAAVAISGVLAVGGLALASMDDGLGKVRVVITMDGESIYNKELPIESDAQPILDDDLSQISFRATSQSNAGGLLISGDVRQIDIGTRVRIDPIPNIEHEISSARVSVSHSQLTSMRRIEHSDQPGDYYEEPQISTVSTSEVVALQQGKESHLGMGVPGADRAEFKITLALVN